MPPKIDYTPSCLKYNFIKWLHVFIPASTLVWLLLSNNGVRGPDSLSMGIVVRWGDIQTLVGFNENEVFLLYGRNPMESCKMRLNHRGQGGQKKRILLWRYLFARCVVAGKVTVVFRSQVSDEIKFPKTLNTRRNQ